eukprot:m.258613 g.258613  ORF g.258613 m.258613 type:complete len:73 (+) comp31589_c0_seq1:575-793(+)
MSKRSLQDRRKGSSSLSFELHSSSYLSRGREDMRPDNWTKDKLDRMFDLAVQRGDEAAARAMDKAYRKSKYR